MKRMPNLHPNGFWIYLVKVFSNGARIRLHYWPATTKKLESPHDHRSWFISLPLFGLFEERRYEETEDTNLTVLRCHATTSGGNGRPLSTPMGKGGVKQIFRRWRLPLIPYFCGSSVIHSFVPRSPGPALSIVLFGPPRKVPRAWVEQEDRAAKMRAVPEISAL